MAVYKVIQDIEAEDKLFGPLTLKSFIYAAVAGLLIFIDFRLLLSGAPAVIKLPIIFILLFPMALFATLASPLGRDQPTEVWLLSHIRFLLKQRQRTWNQSGISQLVTITVPKKDNRRLTNGLSQTEVQSRLQALAGTLDSRGWVVKNSAVSLGGQAGYLNGSGGDSDRLVGTSSLPQQAPVVDIHPADDIMDEENNSTAQHFNQLMQQADAQRKQSILAKLNATRQNSAATPSPEDTRFLDNPQTTKGNTVFVGRQVVAPQSDNGTTASANLDAELSAEAQKLLESRHKRDAEIHRRSASFKPKTQTVPKPAQNTVTAVQTAAKLELAQSGNELSVASVAQLANRTSRVQEISPGEVVISLH